MSINLQSQMKPSQPQSIEEILDGLYINPKLAEVERFLSAETNSAGEYLPFAVTIKIVSPTRAKTILKSFRRSEVTDTMACSNISFDEAQIKYPHLFDYV